MSAYAVPTGPATWDHTPWQRWVAEVALPVGDAALWAARLLAAWAAAAVAVLVVWPLRLAYRLGRWVWADANRLFCSVVFGCPASLVVVMLPHVRWPGSYAEAVASVQTAGYVIGGAFLLLMAAQLSGGGGSCCGHGARAFVASPDGTKTTRWTIALHEAAHLVVGKALGRRTGGARIWGSHGLTRVSVRHDDPAGEVAIDLAGALGAGTEWGCDSDKRNAKRRLRVVEPKRRGGVYQQGKALGRRLVREHRGDIERVATELYEAPNGTVVR